MKPNLSITCGLRLRLLLSHSLVTATALGLVALLAHSYKAEAFNGQLATIRQQAITRKKDNPNQAQNIDDISNPILQSFHTINATGSLFALGAGTLAVSLLSYAMAIGIARPVREIEQAVQAFSTGNLDVRIPPSSIPEMHRMGLSINNMAMSLQGNDARRRDMITDVAHELGAPLTVLQGYLEMLQEEQIQPSADVFTQMYDEVLRLNRLRVDVLELLKIQSGHLPLHLEQFNPKAILYGLVATFQGVDTVRRQCRINLVCQETLPEVIADQDRFKQIIINLISNAISYTPTGTITVQAWSEADRLLIAVVDTGIGIAAKDLPHIFERFWRAENSRKVTSGGSGIGLALTKGLIERQGGEIEVESELGKGTTFRFWLPAFQPSVVSHQFTWPACDIGESRKVARPTMARSGTKPQ